MRFRGHRLLVAGALVASASVVWVAAGPTPVALAVDNPPIADSCGLDVSLVLDASGSISGNTGDPQDGDVSNVRNAAEAFLDALKDTDSSARVTQFATVFGDLAPSTLVTDGSLAQGGVHQLALQGYYNPQPPIPADVTVREGTVTNNRPSSDSRLNQYTNWDQGLNTATGGSPTELVVFITDGDPTALDLDQPGDEGDPGPPPDVLYKTDSTGDSLTRAVAEADAIKSAGTRMLAIGVGAAVNNAQSAQRLEDIAGPQVVSTQAELDAADSLNDIDVALVQDFDDLAQFLRSVVLQLCSPSLTITKLAQSADDDTYQPAPGWSMTVTPSVAGGTFDWILPDTAPAASKSLDTNANGSAQFQWEPDPPESDSQATVQEVLEAGFLAGRPGNPDYRCELRDEFGNVRDQEGELDGSLSFVLDPIGQEIVTCTIWNSFDYQPDIALTKVDDPTVVRGDLTPPAVVTSTFEVTNPGNTPLSSVSVTDDKCTVSPGPGAANPGDTNGDLRLDTTETWQFTCTRDIVTPASTDPAGLEIPNNAETSGTDPAGTRVTDTADATITAFDPAIELTKLVDGADQVTVPTGTDVTYTFDVANTGNTPLGTVTLVDDTAPCDDPNNVSLDADGNGDDILDVAEVWTYSCTANRDANVVNTAVVTGTPLNPLDGNQPFPDPNPVVTDTDDAEVDVTDPGIELTKTVDPTIVLLNEAGDPEPVDYTFTAENTGTDSLTRPAENPGGTQEPGWILDPNCGPIIFVDDGGGNGDDLLDPGETWNFACPQPVGIDQSTFNVASIAGDPIDPATGEPIPDQRVFDLAIARVQVLQPEIDVIKTALRPVVVDPDALAESGPDVPRRAAAYRYEVFNTGNVPLDLNPDPPVDDICGPLEYEGGNTNDDEYLDVGEIWVYTCEVILDREDANTPPVTGAESGLVQNTVTVVGTPEGPTGPEPTKDVTATDTAQVLVIEPGISLTKTASAPVVRAGRSVTYTFVVGNTGDVGLDVRGPEDDKCSPLAFQGGDTNGNGLLDGVNSAVPEEWTYTCTREIGLPELPATTDVNVATVAGVDPLGNVYTATDDAEVRIIDPAIDLEKTVSDSLVPVGTEVTYDFTVTNVGTSPLAADDVLGQIVLGDVSDPSQPSCTSPTFVGGDDGGDGLLPREPAEVWTYQCTAVIDAPTTNIALVVGLGGTQLDPPLTTPVAALDTAFVQTFQPGIAVVKTAEPTVVVGSGEVTYTYEVTNTGNVPLADVATRITDDTCAPVEYVSGDIDEDGLLDTPNSIFEDALDETWIFTCTTTIDATTTNTVIVPGTPVNPGGDPLCDPADSCDTEGTDTATVVVVEPATIIIAKETTVESDTAFEFTFGDESFVLADGQQREFTNLMPGDYLAVELELDGWTLESIVCVDPTDDTTIDDGTSTIVLVPGETVTCTFTNSPNPSPTTTTTTTTIVRRPLPQTGGDLAGPLRLAVAATTLGAVLLIIAYSRRRRTPA